MLVFSQKKNYLTLGEKCIFKTEGKTSINVNVPFTYPWYTFYLSLESSSNRSKKRFFFLMSGFHFEAIIKQDFMFLNIQFPCFTLDIPLAPFKARINPVWPFRAPSPLNPRGMMGWVEGNSTELVFCWSDPGCGAFGSSLPTQHFTWWHPDWQHMLSL